MKKIADFIVEKYKIVIFVFIILTIIAAICSTHVTINTDLTKYLPDDSDMKVGMELMEDEFGETTSDSTAIRIMFTDLSESEKQEMVDKLEEISYIDSVTYDSESEDYNKDNHTKYDITVAGSYGSEEESSVETSLENEFQDYEMTYVVDDTAANSIPKTVLLLALGILIIILLVMTESWFEPVLFIITIIMAIILNLGTNLILGTVSNTTSSLGPILQLVLSMDYSIILMNRYHQELEVADNRKDAMKIAWIRAFGSISSSSLTTIVGLLALVFMSFKLGRDVGIVLAKGVLISVISVLTFLPGITMIATPLIQKTKKKAPIIPTGGLAKFSYKFRKIITPAFLLLFIGVYFFQQNTELTYSMNSEDEISKTFPKSQTVVMMYDNDDEDGITAVEEELESYNKVVSVTGYGNMLGKENTVTEMKEYISDLSSGESEFINSMDESLLEMLYYDYFTHGEVHPMTAMEFIQFLQDEVVNGKTFGDQFGGSVKKSMGKLEMGGTLNNVLASKKEYTPQELYQLISGFSDELDENKVNLIYLYHDSLLYSEKDWKLNILEFVDYLVDDVSKDAKFEIILNDQTKEKLIELQSTLHDASDSLKGKNYSRVLLKIKDLDSMDDINSFYSYLVEKLDGTVQGKYYLIGDSAMSYEMSQIFDSELTLITLLTAVAIFIIVALTFRNLVLPAILVLIVQCGVYITVSVVGIQGMSLYYLALLMVECILMGSTIDYGILFTTYYLECRETMDIKNSLKTSYRGSIHTIMTSGSILVIVTGVLSNYFPDPSVSEICKNISIGAFSAAMLILFILPGVLATMDKFIVKKKN